MAGAGLACSLCTCVAGVNWPGVFTVHTRGRSWPGVFTVHTRGRSWPGVFTVHTRGRSWPGVFTVHTRGRSWPGVFTVHACGRSWPGVFTVHTCGSHWLSVFTCGRIAFIITVYYSNIMQIGIDEFSFHCWIVKYMLRMDMHWDIVIIIVMSQSHIYAFHYILVTTHKEGV